MTDNQTGDYPFGQYQYVTTNVTTCYAYSSAIAIAPMWRGVLAPDEYYKTDKSTTKFRNRAIHLGF